MRRVGALQLGNVVGHGAGMIGSKFLVAVSEKTLQRRLGGISGSARGGNDVAWMNDLGVHRREFKQSPCHACKQVCLLLPTRQANPCVILPRWSLNRPAASAAAVLRRQIPARS